jgi:hypothetical protein
LAETNDNQLAKFRHRIAERESKRRDIITKLIEDVADRLFDMASDDDQERLLVKMRDARVQQN